MSLIFFAYFSWICLISRFMINKESFIFNCISAMKFTIKDDGSSSLICSSREDVSLSSFSKAFLSFGIWLSRCDAILSSIYRLSADVPLWISSEFSTMHENLDKVVCSSSKSASWFPRTANLGALVDLIIELTKTLAVFLSFALSWSTCVSTRIISLFNVRSKLRPITVS